MFKAHTQHTHGETKETQPRVYSPTRRFPQEKQAHLLSCATVGPGYKTPLCLVVMGISKIRNTRE